MRNILRSNGSCRNALAVAAVAFGALTLGCAESGPELHEVRGTVSYQGKPLPLGKVFFVPKDGRPGNPGKIDQHGRYKLEAAAGEHAVGIIAMPPLQGDPDQILEGGGEGSGRPVRKSLIPTKYNRFDTSGITVTVEPDGPNQIDIDLK